MLSTFWGRVLFWFLGGYCPCSCPSAFQSISSGLQNYKIILFAMLFLQNLQCNTFWTLADNEILQRFFPSDLRVLKQQSVMRLMCQ
ncbi:hypothetical protein F5890DRAFT_1547296 [Lentinula detonsa]|uniref:Uncharacterized protein n=1 Tax=Lentinula detonsa TaxID=2804962 RepID=A0AA38UMY2_9AGAR|nr:hypothetical protein F5890DRAFT_1547296 [Lentinula detonsa]